MSTHWWEYLFAPGILLALSAIGHWIIGLGKEFNDMKIQLAENAIMLREFRDDVRSDIREIRDTMNGYENRLRIVEKPKHIKG